MRLRVLLDTHVFLWYIAAHPRLPTAFFRVIRDPGNKVYLSVTSVWETVIKHGRGNLPMPESPAEYLPRLREEHGITSLTIDEGVMTHLASLPAIHRDPFDRIIVAQALQHGLTIATVDPLFAAYPVSLLPQT